MMNKIVVIGSSNIDMLMKMDHLPARGETVTDAVFQQVFGGKGANQAVAAARSGGDVAFVNCVGDDAYAKTMVNNFKLDGINTEYVFSETGISSGTALIMIGEEGDNYLSVAPGANYRLTPQYIDTVEELLKKAEILVLQYEILPETLAYTLQKAAEHNVRLMLNFAPARNIDRKLLSKVDILVVNEIEAGFLTNSKVESEKDMEQAAKELLELGVETVVLTLGAEGSYVAGKESKRHIPAFKVTAIDTTAAGDTYCGCLATALTEGKTMDQAVVFASAGAAISVTKMGAQPSAPTRKEIDSFISSK
ncbi:MAG: ribokinase [bacterium]